MKERIIELRNKGFTYSQIAKKVNLSHQRIHQIVTGYVSPSGRSGYIENPENIKIYTKRKREFLGLPTGIVNSNTGGRDYIRELVRMRDKHTCQMCRKKWMTTQRRFDVHHEDGDLEGKSHMKGIIESDKKNMDKMITLCHRCHLNLDSVKKKMAFRTTKPNIPKGA